VPLEAFPVGSTGKVDRAALLAANHPPQVLAPAPSTAGAAGEAEAEDPVADAVRAIWTRVLGHEVGLDDNFFTAGGHSLLLTQIVAALRSELGVDLPLRALFEAPDLRALARRVEDALLAGLDAQAAS
jgi:acyl carrier protein